MKVKKILLPLALAVSANYAMADYKWYYNPQAIIGPFDSPYDLCQSLGADIMNMDPVYLITWGMVSPGRCDNPGGTGFFRIGSGCDTGKSYDYKQMSCEPNEPDGPNGSNKRPEQCEGMGIPDITGQCNPQANPEPDQCNPETLGNPILIATGQKVEITIDIELSNSLLRFSRNYWSSRLFSESIGIAWQHNWQMRIEQLQSRDRVKLYRENGRGIIFTPRNGRWESDSNDKEVLTRLANDQGWRVQRQDGVIELYNNLGQLISYSKKGYSTVTLTYNANNQLTTLTEENGRKLTLTYNAKGLITKVASSTGISSTYTYDSKSRLTRFTKNAKNKTYHYENTQYPQLLTGITDERGIRYATWTYNEKGQAISSEHAGGVDKYIFEYLPDNKTRVTNPLGKSAVYHFQDIRLEKKIKKIEGEPINTCIATVSSYTYNAEGLPIYEYTKNDATIKYEYNDRGLQTARNFSARGLSYNIYTKWHDTLSLPVEVNHNGQKQTYQYDNDGRLIKYSDGTKDSGITDPVYDSTLLQFNDFTDPANNLWTTHNNPQIVQDDDAIAENCLLLTDPAYLETSSTNITNFGTGEFTIEYWVKPDSSMAGKASMILASQVSDTDRSFFVTGFNQFREPFIQFNDTNNSINIANGMGGGYTLFDGNWHHIAVVRNATGQILWFLDGIHKKTTNGWSNYNITSAAGTLIGNSYHALNQYNFVGKLDQVRVIKKAIYSEDFTPSKEPYVYEAIE